MSATNWEEVYRVQNARIAELEKENAEFELLRKRLPEMQELQKAAHKANTLAYISAQLMSPRQRELRDAIRKEIEALGVQSWAEIQAVCQMVKNRHEETK